MAEAFLAGVSVAKPGCLVREVWPMMVSTDWDAWKQSKQENDLQGGTATEQAAGVGAGAF